MRRGMAFLVSGLMALAFMMVPAPAGATVVPDGLWADDYEASTADCGPYGPDANTFCYIDDGGAVELGVKFTTSAPAFVTGVRVYRVDAGSVTGSLWKADGTLLATGSFSAQAGHGWQDLTFSAPVAITTGVTYIASYFAPNADYAFQWDYFAASAFTVGPITALKSVEGDRNGVYCYLGQSCGSLPTISFRDSNYWVTPLWVQDTTGPEITITRPADGATYLLNQSVTADYACTDDFDPAPSCVGTTADGAAIDTDSVGSHTFTVNAEDASGNQSSLTHDYSVAYKFTGFTAPVDNNLLNVAKAGQAIPLKFRVTDANGSPITNLSGVTVKATSLSCSLGETTDLLEEYATGNSGLQNLGNGYYQFNWATPKAYAKSCKTVSLILGEGGTHTADFQFTR